MIALETTADARAAVDRAHDVAFSSYVLARRSRMFRALAAAADHGAHVAVTLQAQPYGDPQGRLAKLNADAVAALRKRGADATLSDPAAPPMHLKACVADGVAFLDDRNWPTNGNDTVVASDDPQTVAAVTAALHGHTDCTAAANDFATCKQSALALEARAISESGTDGVACESESFGFGAVFRALERRAHHAPVRLLVSERDLRDDGTELEHRALRVLRAAGVEVRVGRFEEKLCLSGTGAWLGSANATAGAPTTTDWGLVTDDRAVVEGVRSRFEDHWRHAVAFEPSDCA